MRAADYDAAIMTWVNDPTPSSGIPNMWRRGGGTNLGGYHNPAFEREADRAANARNAAEAAEAWKAAFRILAQDAPAIVLAAPDNIAAVHRRFSNVRIRPDSYWALVRTWQTE
jgi:ABC-type oligopeptide transport system substrate-binding subunit